MAFDLVARLKFIDDGATALMRKVEKQIERVKKATDTYTDANGRLRDSQGRFVSSGKSAARQLSVLERLTQRASKSTDRFGKTASSAMDRAARSTGGLVRSIGGVAAAYVSARAAAGLFDKTIGAAANYELREVTVKAMFGGDFVKNAQKYLDFVEGRSAVSQFTMDNFLTAGKSFIPTTKDNAKLEKMVNLAERLGAIDPEQGLEGAAYALKEFFSGDAVSLVERFELPRTVMNDLKDLPLDTQLKELDKYFNKIGATNELIEAQASTAMGEWRKSTSKMTKALREMGTAGLEKITPLLRDFNKWLESTDFKRFRDAGVRAFAELFDGATKAVRAAANYLDTNFLSNPEFQRLTTLESKVNFVLDDLTPVLNDGLKFGGELAAKMISGMAVEMTKGILDNPVLATTLGVAALIASPTPIGLTVALSVTAPAWFKALVEGTSPVIRQQKEFERQFSAWEKGIDDATKREAEGKPAPGAAEGWYISAPEPKSWGQEVWDGFNEGFNSFREYIKHPTPLKLEVPSWLRVGIEQGIRITGNPFFTPAVSNVPGHAGGLDRVPYNGYASILHRDEMVLTRTEAQEYRESGGGRGRSGGQVVVTGNNFYVRDESDIDKIASKLARALAQ